MNRVPVTVRVGWVPPRATAWVPCPRTIVVQRLEDLHERLVAHELKHVLQAEEHRPWPLAYVWQWIRCGFSYVRMPFEVEARAAEHSPFERAWARDVLRQVRP